MTVKQCSSSDYFFYSVKEQELRFIGGLLMFNKNNIGLISRTFKCLII